MTGNAIDETLNQDQPDSKASDRQARADKGDQHQRYTDLSAVEISNRAQKEWREQNIVRGPVVVPEWNHAAFHCRRLNGLQMMEINEIYREHGYAGAFCFRALNSNGERIFPSIPSFKEEIQTVWNPAVVERVVAEFAALSRTQLTDAELGKS